jgi:methyl-accepting chemotaxis protein
VNQAVTQMDEATQQNAALVEEAAAAAESMKEQAQGLTQAVAVFRLAQGAAAPAASTPKAAATVTPLQPRARKEPVAAARPVAAPRKAVNAPRSTTDEWEEF